MATLREQRRSTRRCVTCDVEFVVRRSEDLPRPRRSCSRDCDTAARRLGSEPILNGDGTASVPLRRRDGVIVAFALIDVADVALVGRWSWHLNSRGYASRGQVENGRQRTVRLHREILGLRPGDGIEGDHINRDRLDNRRANLRQVPIGTNAQNQSAHRDGSSRFRGVSWSRDKGKWTAQVKARGRTHYLGVFDTEEAASQAASSARMSLLPYATG